MSSTDLAVLLAEDDERFAELERRELFQTSDPVAVVGQAARVATELARIIEEKELYTRIGNRKHVRVEGWTLLGNMLRVYPILVWSRPVEDGWEARVEARTIDGTVVGAAESQCTRAEKEWGPNPTRGRPRDDFALRSMAQTRATSKALRMPLGFVFSMAGYDPTPLDEIAHEPDAPTAAAPVLEREPEPTTPVVATAEQGAAIAALMAEVEGYDPVTDWGAWCRTEAAVDSFLTLTSDKAEGLIAALEGKAAELRPPTEPAA